MAIGGARVCVFACWCCAGLTRTGKMKRADVKLQERKKPACVTVCPGEQVGKLEMTVWSCVSVMK